MGFTVKKSPKKSEKSSYGKSGTIYKKKCQKNRFYASVGKIIENPVRYELKIQFVVQI